MLKPVLIGPFRSNSEHSLTFRCTKRLNANQWLLLCDSEQIDGYSTGIVSLCIKLVSGFDLSIYGAGAELRRRKRQEEMGGLSSFPSRLGGLGERRGLSRRVRAKSRRRTILVLSKRVRTPLIALIVLFITLHGVECQRGLATRKLSVRLSLWLSVRLSFSRSVKCVICDKTTESCAHSLTADESSFTLVLWQEEWLVGSDPFYLKF